MIEFLTKQKPFFAACLLHIIRRRRFYIKIILLYYYYQRRVVTARHRPAHAISRLATDDNITTK